MELEAYSYYVAGTAGLMLLLILAKKHTPIEDSTIDLGKAMKVIKLKVF